MHDVLLEHTIARPSLTYTTGATRLFVHVVCVHLEYVSGVGNRGGEGTTQYSSCHIGIDCLI